ncbi:MAG: glycosyltransferase family 39 protein [Treponema sp.]|nr:glycosyltransferase family 39 protein [Treponema sp.]
MNKAIKILLITVCIVSGIVSFFYLCLRNRDVLGEYYAQSSVNVEIKKEFAYNIAIVVETAPNPCSYWLSPTTMPDDNTKTAIMHKSIPLKRPYWNPAIQFPMENAEEALMAIDNIAFFTGNKLHYFSHEEVQKFKRADKDVYSLFFIPGVYYERSVVFRNWSNYYGDINFGIKTLTAFLLFPGKFIPTYFFLILLLFIFRKQIAVLYAAVLNKKNNLAVILLIFILAAGFILRWNGYVRHSGWTDEIYSATRAGNPAMPFLNTFTDPGNPPFYYILLRFWFKVFGWSEESGTILSVLLGTFSIFSIYLPVKLFFGRKAALCAALFTAFSGFSIGYSQEMRGYILLMTLAPLISLALFKFKDKPSIKNLVIYILLSIMTINTHHYGTLLIVANFLLFISYVLYQKQWKKGIAFTAGNAVAVLSAFPYFYYMLFIRNHNFIHNDSKPGIEHFFVFFIIIIFAFIFIFCKNKMLDKYREKTIKNDQYIFFVYLLAVPALIFSLSFIFSFFRMMISFRYLWPVSAPFGFAVSAIIVTYINKINKWPYLTVLLIYIFTVSFNGIMPDIPGRGIEGYKEARAYIAEDSAANPGKNSVMLNNAPANAAYYGYPNLPAYSENPDADVLYILNDIFYINENDMYNELQKNNIDCNNMLKIYFDIKYPRGDGNVVFKIYLKPKLIKQL